MIQRQVNAAVENVVRQVQSNVGVPTQATSSASDAQSSPSSVSGANEMKSNPQGISSFLPTNVRVKISPPATFTGARSLNVEIWLNEMKHYLLLCGVLGEEQQVAVAASYLKERPLNGGKVALNFPILLATGLPSPLPSRTVFNH